MPFSFWVYLFFFLEIYTFLYYANEESDDVIGGSTLTVQHSIKNVSKKYWSSVLQTWHQKCTSPKRKHDTYSVVVMATLSAPVSFCQKLNIPICNLLKWDRGFSSAHNWFPHCLNNPQQIVVSGRSSFRIKSGNFSFKLNGTSGIHVVIATAQQVSFCFFCDVQP